MTVEQATCPIELTADGHLRLLAGDAARWFPDDALVARRDHHDIVLVPVRGGAGGGLILKQRNSAGDRAVLIAEALGFQPVEGRFQATWDDRTGSLRVPLVPMRACPRPQPVGLFPFPRSHLLVAAASADELAAAAAGDDLAARRLLPETVDGVSSDRVGQYNAFVLAPSPSALSTLLASGDPTLGPLARAAAFAHGLSDDLPTPDSLDGELRSLVLMTAAAGLFERGDDRAARTALAEAIAAAEAPAPVFAAVLKVQLADSLPPEAASLSLDHLRHAHDLAASARLPFLTADIWMRRGMAHQILGGGGARDQLLEAVACYQQALAAGVTPESDPVRYGQLQNNLGLAYLCMPTRDASDQLRTGIAVQSFRRALEVTEKSTDPQQWASVTMNLASALQYLPSTHPADNLAEAVDRYEEVLAVRTTEGDPIGRGRALMNQANALAHLAIFVPALEKLDEAAELFARHGAEEEKATVTQLIDGIHARLDELGTATPAQRPR